MPGPLKGLHGKLIERTMARMDRCRDGSGRGGRIHGLFHTIHSAITYFLLFEDVCIVDGPFIQAARGSHIGHLHNASRTAEVAGDAQII